MIVFPAILEDTPERLFLQISRLLTYYSHFQIDIIDGVYVPNKTVQIEEILKTVFIKNSLFQDATFEFHLMVKDYEKDIEKLLELKKFLNIETVLIHASLSPNLSLLTTRYSLFSFGLVLNSEDSVETIKINYDLEKVPLIQIMSIRPGAQGNPFIPESLKKIEQLRNTNYRNKIALDGGINDKTIPLILSQKFLPDILCPGSFLTKEENLEKKISYLRSLFRGVEN